MAPDKQTSEYQPLVLDPAPSPFLDAPDSGSCESVPITVSETSAGLGLRYHRRAVHPEEGVEKQRHFQTSP